VYEDLAIVGHQEKLGVYSRYKVRDSYRITYLYDWSSRIVGYTQGVVFTYWDQVLVPEEREFFYWDWTLKGTTTHYAVATNKEQTFDSASFSYTTWEQGNDGTWQEVQKEQSYQIEEWYTSEKELPYTVQEWEKTLKKVTYQVHHAEWVQKEVIGTWPIREPYVVHYGELKYVYETEYVRFSYETALIGKVLKTVDYSTAVLGTEDKELNYQTPEIDTVDKQIEYEVMERRPCSCPSCDCPEGAPPIPVPDPSIFKGPYLGSAGAGQRSPWQPEPELTGRVQSNPSQMPSGERRVWEIRYSPDDARGDFHLALGNSSVVETETGSPMGGWDLSNSYTDRSADDTIGGSGTRYLSTINSSEYGATASGKERNLDLALGDSSITGGFTPLSGISIAPSGSPGGGQDRSQQGLMGNLAGASAAMAALAASFGILLRCWPYILKVIEFLGRARAWLNRIPFLVRWANWLRNLTYKQLAGLIFGFIMFVLTQLLTWLDVLIEALEAWERSLSHKYEWDDCRMKLLRGIRYSAEELRRWLERLKKQVEDAWRDKAPYDPGYHP